LFLQLSVAHLRKRSCLLKVLLLMRNRLLLGWHALKLVVLVERLLGVCLRRRVDLLWNHRGLGGRLGDGLRGVFDEGLKLCLFRKSVVMKALHVPLVLLFAHKKLVVKHLTEGSLDLVQ